MEESLDKLTRIKKLYGPAIRNGHIGRRVLMREFDLTRTEAENVLDDIRNPDPDEIGALEEIHDVVYDAANDTYIFRGLETDHYTEREVVVKGEKIRNLKRDYTAGFTQKETCYLNDISQLTFKKIRAQFNWTHASLPATDEEVSIKGDDITDELVEEERKRAIKKKLERQKWNRMKRDAEAFREIEETLLEEFGEYLSDVEPKSVDKLDLSRDKSPHAVVLPVFDLHYGMYGLVDETGDPYDRGEAKKRLIKNADDIRRDLANYNIEKLMVGFGSDFFHVDTSNGTTTAGTPQDMDGTPAQILKEGSELMVEYIDRLRTIGPVEAYMVPGNHDRVLTVALMQFLQAWYRNAKDVTIISDALAPRQYTVYGRTLIGFDHGDGIKHKDLPAIISTEARDKLSETDHTCFFVGHLHHELTRDYGSVTVYQLGSPTGTDRWHHVNGYTTSRKQFHAYLIDKERGMVACKYYPVLI